MIGRRAVWLLLALAMAADPGAAIDAFLRSPEVGRPAFGQVEIAAEIVSATPVESVVFRVDGRVVARFKAPPYRATVDVGSDNVEHLFEVFARTRDGEEASASRRTPRFQVDEELDLDLRQLYVTATRDGHRVLDFEKRHFRVLDEGEPQEIVTFERGDVPLTAALVVDTSVSMRGRRLRQALAGARSFVDGMRELDLAMLLLFSDQLLHRTRFTGNAEELGAGLEAVEAGGGTAVNDHVYLAMKLLDRQQGRRVIILLSDGGDIESTLTVDDVLWKARRSETLVYWIRPQHSDSDLMLSWSSAWRTAEQHREGFLGLEQLVRETGGRIVEIADVEEAPAAFQEILRELRDQYVIGYYPSEVNHDGSWHRVRIRLNGVSAELRAREGYVDQ